MSSVLRKESGIPPATSVVGFLPRRIMKILVTGSKGIIGTKLVQELIDRGHVVYGCDSRHDKDEVSFSTRTDDKASTYIRCDVSKFRQIERIFDTFGQFDYVYHLAAEFGRWNGEDFYENLWLTNAVGTKNIINLCETNHVRLIFASSSEVYGDYQGKMVEDVMNRIEVKQLNDYAISKWANELQIANNKNVESVIFRFFNTYGAGEYYSPYRSVICRFVYCALNRIPFVVYKDHYRTHIYIDDAVRTIANICDTFHSGETYNIGGSKLYSIEETSDIIIKLTRCDPALRTLQSSELQTTIRKIPDISKAINDLGHEDTVDFITGINNTIEWMKEVYEIVG